SQPHTHTQTVRHLSPPRAAAATAAAAAAAAVAKRSVAKAVLEQVVCGERPVAVAREKGLDHELPIKAEALEALDGRAVLLAHLNVLGAAGAAAFAVALLVVAVLHVVVATHHAAAATAAAGAECAHVARHAGELLLGERLVEHAHKL